MQWVTKRTRLKTAIIERSNYTREVNPTLLSPLAVYPDKLIVIFLRKEFL